MIKQYISKSFLMFGNGLQPHVPSTSNICSYCFRLYACGAFILIARTGLLDHDAFIESRANQFPA